MTDTDTTTEEQPIEEQPTEQTISAPASHVDASDPKTGDE